MSEPAFGKTYHRPDLVWQRQREVEFYHKLDGVPHFPDLVGVEGGTMYITHCGSGLTKGVLDGIDMTDLTGQLSEILDLLQEVGIRHRDITPTNLTWKDGVLYLVDFGWSVWSTEEDSPEPVPQVMREWMCDKSDARQALEVVAWLIGKKNGKTIPWKPIP